MPFITDKWNFALPLGLLLIYIFAFRPRRDHFMVIFAVAVILLIDGTSQFLKDLFQRSRPCQVLERAVCYESFYFVQHYISDLIPKTTQLFKDTFQPGDVPSIVKSAAAAHSGPFSFPSNHASNTFGLAAFISYNYRKLAIPSFLIASLVGYSRIYLTSHYPTDVLGGAAWGMLLGFTVAMAVRRLMRFSQADEPLRTDTTKESLASHTKPSQ
jgi:membrane-associated phospholipid phosphatase